MEAESRNNKFNTVNTCNKQVEELYPADFPGFYRAEVENQQPEHQMKLTGHDGWFRSLVFRYRQLRLLVKADFIQMGENPA